jgi:hypothetical protein
MGVAAITDTMAALISLAVTSAAAEHERSGGGGSNIGVAIAPVRRSGGGGTLLRRVARVLSALAV